jgi:hypothetical protein
MTEKQWLASPSPQRMLNFLRFKVSDRKLRLFACACCRRVQDADGQEHGLAALEVAERLAECQATNDERVGAVSALLTVGGFTSPHIAALFDNSATAADQTAYIASRAPGLINVPQRLSGGPGTRINPAWTEAVRNEKMVQVSLLRDIFSNPFRPVTLDSAWRTSTVTALAKQMYESRDFGAMPILVDALQDAGCTSEDILDHCRDAHSTHVRGCWVVDLVLGKE